MSRVLVVGSANTDLTVRAPRLPRPHETVSDGELMISFGGKGANQALAARFAGGGTELICKIGSDDFGDRMHEHLLQSGLPGEGLLRDPAQASGVALIAVDLEGNNQILVAPGSNRNLSAEDVALLDHLFAEAEVLLVQLEIPLPTVEASLRAAREHGLTTILNPAPCYPLPQSLLSLVDILTPNEREAEGLSGLRADTLEQAAQAAAALRRQGANTVIVTLGRQGALLSEPQSESHIPAFEIQAVDSVAAGDAFNGALAAGLVQGRSLPESVRSANAAGALCAMQRGAQEALPMQAEIDRFLNTQQRRSP
jgi:ribokinase